MGRSGHPGRGFLVGLRDMLGLPGAPGTVEDLVHQIAVHAIERPRPDHCPRCNGELVLLATEDDPVHAELTTFRTSCRECGIEEDWHQRGA